MIAPSQLALLRAVDSQVLPGIDTAIGNQQSPSTLLSPINITTNTAAPIYYNPTTHIITIKGAGSVLSGYNLQGVMVNVLGNSVTIQNCTFNDISPGYWGVWQAPYTTGMTVKNCTFTGGDDVTENCFIMSEWGSATITSNSFINTPTHAIQVSGGAISGNYFSGEGYHNGAHADAICVYDTFSPVSIIGNFIDWTENPDSYEIGTNAIRITTDNGNTSNVTVQNNVLLGASYTVSAAPSTVCSTYDKTATVGQLGTVTNINISNNIMGLSWYGAFYPTLGSGVTTSNNQVFGYSNSRYSAAAWAAYAAGGTGTAYRIQSTGGYIASNPNGSTTLYGDGLSVRLTGSKAETVFVGGAGGQVLWGGVGGNIYKYLSVGDSYVHAGTDMIGNFDPARDVIDLSAIDANLGAGGTQSLQFIGTAPFTATGGQVRYEQVLGQNVTLVEADLYGDHGAQLEIRLQGLVNLTAANFALTPAQSAETLAAGARMGVTSTGAGSGPHEYAYTNVGGEPYASFNEIYSVASTMAAEAFNNNDGSGRITLLGGGVTVSDGGAGQSVAVGGSTFSIAPHLTETVTATGRTGETLAFGSGFGGDTVVGFDPSANSLRFQTSMFSYLGAGMSQAEDLAAVLAHATMSGGGITIVDSAHDSLTLTGVGPTALVANSTHISFM